MNEQTREQISINLSSNILGLSNAATPSAIKAMQGLDDGSGKINNAMTMLMIVNCLSFQMLPTTVMGMMANSGSQNLMEKTDTEVQKDKIRGFTQIIRSIRDKNNIFTLSNYHTSIV